MAMPAAEEWSRQLGVVHEELITLLFVQSNEERLCACLAAASQLLSLLALSEGDTEREMRREALKEGKWQGKWHRHGQREGEMKKHDVSLAGCLAVASSMEGGRGGGGREAVKAMGVLAGLGFGWRQGCGALVPSLLIATLVEMGEEKERGREGEGDIWDAAVVALDALLAPPPPPCRPSCTKRLRVAWMEGREKGESEWEGEEEEQETWEVMPGVWTAREPLGRLQAKAWELLAWPCASCAPPSPYAMLTGKVTEAPGCCPPPHPSHARLLLMSMAEDDGDGWEKAEEKKRGEEEEDVRRGRDGVGPVWRIVGLVRGALGGDKSRRVAGMQVLDAVADPLFRLAASSHSALPGARSQLVAVVVEELLRGERGQREGRGDVASWASVLTYVLLSLLYMLFDPDMPNPHVGPLLRMLAPSSYLR